MTSGFNRDSAGRAKLGNTLIRELLASAQVPTPAYFYDLNAIKEATAKTVQNLGERNLVAYAVKANSAASIIRAITAQGAGCDVVSGGELRLALRAGVEPQRIVMSGVAKTNDELDFAIDRNIKAIQVESLEELKRVTARARHVGKRARLSFRVNPSVQIDSHAHISTGHDRAKFGIPQDDFSAVWQWVDAAPEALQAVGVSTHVGSNLKTVEPYLCSARVVCALAHARRQKGLPLEFVNFGGGFGIAYDEAKGAEPEEFARSARDLAASEGLGELQVVIEPGRSLVGPYGILVVRIIQTKTTPTRQWALIDGAMNDLLRPMPL